MKTIIFALVLVTTAFAQTYPAGGANMPTVGPQYDSPFAADPTDPKVIAWNSHLRERDRKTDEARLEKTDPTRLRIAALERLVSGEHDERLARAVGRQRDANYRITVLEKQLEDAGIRPKLEGFLPDDTNFARVYGAADYPKPLPYRGALEARVKDLERRIVELTARLDKGMPQGNSITLDCLDRTGIPFFYGGLAK